MLWLLCVCRLAPPRPPSSLSTRVVYGAEEGRFKGVVASSLLSPARELVDELWLLRDRQSEANLRHVAAENAYAEQIMECTPSWRSAAQQLHERLERHRAAEEDGGELIWHRGADVAGFEYATLRQFGAYPQYLRRRHGSDDDPELLLDANSAPALLTSSYDPSVTFVGVVRGVSAFVPSPGGRFIAYTVDTTGEEQFSLMILPAGGPPVPVASVANVDVDIAWGKDDRELFYSTMDATGRPYRLHRLMLPSEAARDAKPSETRGKVRGKTPGDMRVIKRGDKRRAKGGAKRGANHREKQSENQGGAALGAKLHEKLGKNRGAKSALESFVGETIFEELDGRYRLRFRRAAEGSRLIVELTSRDASEMWALPFGGPVTNGDMDSASYSAHSKRDAPARKLRWGSGYAVGEAWHCLAAREAGLVYEADYRRGNAASGGEGQYVLVVVENDEVTQGVLRVLSEADAVNGLGRRGWRCVPGLLDEQTSRRALHGVQCFDAFAAFEGRRDGAGVVLVWRYSDEQLLVVDGLSLSMQRSLLASDHTVLKGDGQWCIRLCAIDEQRYEDDALHLEYSAPISPPRVLRVAISKLRAQNASCIMGVGLPSGIGAPSDEEIGSSAVSVLHEQRAPRGFDPDSYEFGRVWAVADDGTHIPISLLRHKGHAEAAGGALPTLLYGYGSYGATTEAGWDADRIVLADSGMMHAICHVRGGGELGRSWHAGGRRKHKPNTFSDMVACTHRLIELGMARPGSVALEGRSAGGLLVGATMNLAPALFCAALASVPFLDPAGTLQDATLPLTVNEWEEFGNPNEKGSHDTVLGFSPVHNVQPGAAYPPCFFLPALNDARTGWWEAHKFAHALRERTNAVVMVCTDMDGGHFRAPTAEGLRLRARELGFVLAAAHGERFNS